VRLTVRVSSEDANTVQEWHVDPIIEWPSASTAPLRDTIAEMQRLNPGLGLRCAISTWEPDDTKLDSRTAARMRKDLAESPPWSISSMKTRLSTSCGSRCPVLPATRR
jgi:hypothetical protein